MFFFDDQLCRRRVQDIKLITAGRAEERSGSTRWVHDVEMIDGTSLVILDVTLAQISMTPAHVFSSEPGLTIWKADPDGGQDFLNPVVGWAITVDGSIVPVTADGNANDLHGSAVVLSKDGRVWQNGFVQADCLEDFKKLSADNG